eukprot:616513-Pleurochrysis_carterae.AAC.1
MAALERSSSELSIEPSSSLKDEGVLERQQDEFPGQQTCNCKMGYLGLNQEQNAPSRCSKRRAKFQWNAGLERGAMPTCGLDDKCCNDALQAGLAQGR